MFVSIKHKGTTLQTKDTVNKSLTNIDFKYNYTVVDDMLGEINVAFTMPMSLVRLTNSLCTIALHQAYGKHDKEVLCQALDAYYNSEYHANREQDIAFYKRVRRYIGCE